MWLALVLIDCWCLSVGLCEGYVLSPFPLSNAGDPRTVFFHFTNSSALSASTALFRGCPFSHQSGIFSWLNGGLDPQGENVNIL